MPRTGAGGQGGSVSVSGNARVHPVSNGWCGRRGRTLFQFAGDGHGGGGGGGGGADVVFVFRRRCRYSGGREAMRVVTANRGERPRLTAAEVVAVVPVGRPSVSHTR